MTFELNTAMIFAAGRGERMRPLTDTVPKPLLEAGGKALIVWQIEALATAGIRRIVINHAWLGDAIEAALGDGSRWGVEIAYSREGAQALETAGGIARALTLLSGPETQAGHTVFLAVSGDVYTDFDYAALRSRAKDLHAQTTPGLHLIMVPNPTYHPRGDFVLDGDRLVPDDANQGADQNPDQNADSGADQNNVQAAARGATLKSVPAASVVTNAVTGAVTNAATGVVADTVTQFAARSMAEPVAAPVAKRLTFANIGLYDSRTFAPIAAMHPIPRMPLLPVYQDAIATARATGECWLGRWANVGTPSDLAALDQALRAAHPLAGHTASR